MITIASSIPALLVGILLFILANIFLVVVEFIIATIIFIFDFCASFICRRCKNYNWYKKLHFHTFYKLVNHKKWTKIFEKIRVFLSGILLKFAFALVSPKKMYVIFVKAHHKQVQVKKSKNNQK